MCRSAYDRSIAGFFPGCRGKLYTSVCVCVCACVSGEDAGARGSSIDLTIDPQGMDLTTPAGFLLLESTITHAKTGSAGSQSKVGLPSQVSYQ